LGKKTTIGKFGSGSSTKVYNFDDINTKFVGFSGTQSLTKGVLSVAPQSYNSTCLVNLANANATKVENKTDTKEETKVTDN
jgi:hypothetical protein